MADADRIARIQRLEKIARIQELENQVSPAKTDEKTSAGKAFLIGAQEAGTFGARSALGAAGEAIGTGLGTLFTAKGSIPEKISKAAENVGLVFNPARKELTAERVKAESDQPMASLAGNIAGNVATVPLVAAKGIVGAGRLGALGGLGKAASEAENLGEAAEIAGSGLGTGLAFGALSKAGGMAAQKFKDTGSRLAYRALGPGAKAAKINLAKGQVEQIGEAMIKEGILPKTPSSIDKVVDRIGKKLAESGDDLGAVVDKLDDLSIKKGLNKYGVSTRKVAMEVLKDVKVPPSVPGASAINQQARGFVKELVAKNPEFRSIKDAEQFKTLVGKEINWDRIPGSEVPVREQFLRSLYGKLRDNSEQAAIKVGDASKKELSGQFANSKSLFGLLSEAKKIATNKQALELRNNLLSPSDKAATLLGITVGAMQGDDIEERLKNAAVWGSLGLANKAARTISTQQGSRALYNIGNLLQRNADQNIGAIGRTAIQQSTDAMTRRRKGE